MIGLDSALISLGFIIWAIWNAINDPMLGAISDRSNLKMGRRKPFIILGFIPLLVVNVLLWTVPRDPKSQCIHLIKQAFFQKCLEISIKELKQIHLFSFFK